MVCGLVRGIVGSLVFVVVVCLRALLYVVSLVVRVGVVCSLGGGRGGGGRCRGMRGGFGD